MEEKKGLYRWIGKKIFLVCTNGNVYNAVVLEVHDAGNGVVFLTMLDKFSKIVVVNASQIERIEEREEEK